MALTWKLKKEKQFVWLELQDEKKNKSEFGWKAKGICCNIEVKNMEQKAFSS